MTKYETLLVVLDKICEEAPTTLKRYRPQSGDEEKRNQARSRALLHLYLKVKFGLLRFDEREHLLTDKSADGVIDAYYLDKEHRIIYAFQSKFRTSKDNFEKKNIQADELLDMQLGRIVKGENTSEDGKPWNGKIKQFQRELQQTEFRGAYAYKIVILANCKKLTPTTSSGYAKAFLWRSSIMFAYTRSCFCRL
jgi:hypothetical protein